MSIDFATATLAAAALHYAHRRWPVFPCQPNGKAPLTSSGFRAATTDVEIVAGWWHDWPTANIGFVPGRAGYVVIDVDGPEGERAAVALGLLAEPTLRVLTPRGFHLYFKHPGGTIGNTPLAPHLDVRGDLGYVLLPPSRHPCGEVYRADKAAVLPLPPDTPARLTGNGHRRALPPLEAAIPDGQRNDTLFRLGAALRHYGASAAAIHAALRAENLARCRPPLPEDEVGRIAASAARYPAAANVDDVDNRRRWWESAR